MKHDIINCARCGGEHDDLEFEKLLRPMSANDFYYDEAPEGAGEGKYWTMCPTVEQPIILTVVPLDKS